MSMYIYIHVYIHIFLFLYTHLFLYICIGDRCDSEGPNRQDGGLAALRQPDGERHPRA